MNQSNPSLIVFIVCLHLKYECREMEREPNMDKSMQKKNYTIIQITK